MTDPPTIFGVAADNITALATAFLAILTAVVAVVALRQLALLHKQIELLTLQITQAKDAAAEQSKAYLETRMAEEKRHIETNTLQMCQIYFSNPVIHEAANRVYVATDNGKNYDKAKLPEYQHDLITVLNYLNGIGVGVQENLFSGEIVRDHMPNTISKVVDVIIPALIDRPGDYQALIDLRKSWDSRPAYSSAPRQTPKI
jgi:phosphoribosylformylglycinamidine (FGAM) synthase PurS component